LFFIFEKSIKRFGMEEKNDRIKAGKVGVPLFAAEYLTESAAGDSLTA
jgi:hypothetical protein